MRTYIYMMFFFGLSHGFSNPYIKHFTQYKQSSYYKTEVYAEHITTSFYQLKDIQRNIETDSFDISLFDACLFFAANKLRTMHKIFPYAFNDKLQCAAAMHSYQMSIHHFFAHENIYERKLKDPELRMKYVGIKSCTTAENCAKQPIEENDSITYIQLAQEVIEGWYNSPGHRSNLMSRQLKYMGIVAAPEFVGDDIYIVVTQDFCN